MTKFPETEGVMGMFRVIEVRGLWVRLAWWDEDDKELDDVYAGEVTEPSFGLNTMHLMELISSEGQLQIGFCSPAYDEVEYDGSWSDFEDEDEDGREGSRHMKNLQ